MARKITCDKCNKEIASEKPEDNIVSTQIKAAGSIYTQHSDLCDKCLSELIGILREFGEISLEFTPDTLKELSAEVDKQRQELPPYMDQSRLDENGMSLFR